MVIGVPKELSITTIKQEAEEFSRKNKLNATEQKELLFIMQSFVKYYNSMSNSNQMFEQQTIIDSFDEVLGTITETYNGTGIQSRANLFWKLLPIVEKMYKDTPSVSKKTSSSFDSSYQTSIGSSGGSCGSSYSSSGGSCGSSYSSYYYDYGGCGGGGSGCGGHC